MSSSAPAMTRDLRIDFFRGVALLIVLVDHIEGWCNQHLVEAWTLISLGFSDAAEIFVFLSGYVLAYAYSRTLAAGGLKACLRKALKRSVQIYAAYQIAAWTVILIGALASNYNPPAYNEQFRIGEHLGPSLLAALTLRFHPWGFDILAFYVPILPAMAVMLYLRRRVAWLAWAISGGLYLAVQFNPHWNLTRFGDQQLWYFNPMAWQFLFFVGITMGDPVRRPLRYPPPRWLLVVPSAAIVAFGLLVMKLSIPLMQRSPSLEAVLMPLVRFYWDWGDDKTVLQPLRLAHFFALAYLTSVLFPARLKFWSSAVARPIVITGRHSLEVYACGLVLSFLAVLAIQQGPMTTSSVLCMDLAACLASIGFAYGVSAWQGRSLTVSAANRPASIPTPSRASDRTAKRRSKPSRV